MENIPPDAGQPLPSGQANGSGNKNKIFIIIVAVLAVAAAAGWTVVNSRKSANNPPAETATNTSAQVKQSELSQPSALFPTDLPLEQGAAVLQNQTTNLGKRQATWVFLSNKKLQENLDLYKKYVTDTGWSNIKAIDSSGNKLLSAHKQYDDFLFVFEPQKNPDQTKVSIYFTTFPEPKK